MKRLALAGAALVLAVLGLAAGAAADVPGPEHNFPIVREGDPGLPDHTVVRPADLAAPAFKLPIVVWGNGGCRDSNEEYHYFLTHFAAYGFFIVANGPPENPYHPEELDGLADPQPQKLRAAVDWAIRENARPDSLYFGRLDTTRIAVMGQSCGAWEAIDASADPRVRATVAWNNGGDPHAGDVTRLHAPIAFVYGGTSDFTWPETVSSYQRVSPSVPALLADLAPAGHTGMWDDPSAPDPPPGPYEDEPLLVAAQWLALTLYGSDAGRQFFLGPDCGLCRRDGWTVESKNWEQFSAPAPAPAPAPGAGACTSRRVVTVHPRRGVRSAVVLVDGRRVARVRAGHGVQLRFAGHPGGTVVVRLLGRNRRGARVVDVRRYALCA